MTDEQHVYHHAEAAAPTYKAKAGRDAQGRLYWELSLEGFATAEALHAALGRVAADLETTMARLGREENA